MNSLDIHQLFHSLWLHFSSDNYDFFKYEGKTKGTSKKVPIRYYEILGERLETRTNIIYFFVCNFVHDWERNKILNHFIGNYVKKENFEIFENWKNKQKQIVYLLKRNYDCIEDYVRIEKGKTYPECMNNYFSGKEAIEFLVVVLKNNDFMENYWLSRTSDKYFFPEIIKFSKKYQPFLKSKKYDFNCWKIDKTSL